MIDNFYAIDYQVHSFRSHDGKASIDDQCARAALIGLDEIGFSEHKDFDPSDPVVDYFEYDTYMIEIEAARAKWGDKLKIRAGIEIDYQIWFEDKIDSYLDKHAFDFVIGSVHYVDKAMLMTPAYNSCRTAHEAYHDYFKAVQDSISSGLFDILGHLEYANRRGIAAWGAYDPEYYRPELESLFQALISSGKPLEINTAGLHQGLGITYPTSKTVSIYTQMGGNLLSIASDAHHPDQLAHAYSHAAKIAQSLGLTHLCTWQNRNRIEVPLVTVA